MIQLASKSPRRAQLLRQIGVPHTLVDVDVVEQQAADEKPSDYVRRLALNKASAGFNAMPLVPTLGADTIVCCDQHVLEKPVDRDDCLRMLRMLCGRTHQVMTGVAMVINAAEVLVEHAVTDVEFGYIDDNMMRDYWATGEPRDKAGAYAIQGYGGVFVRAIHGSYSNVVGLPIELVSDMLTRFKLPFWVKIPS